MTHKLFEALLWGFSCGLCSVVYIKIIGKEAAFNWWWVIGAKHEGKSYFKPVWSCPQCNAGWVSLISYYFIKVVPAILSTNSGLKMFWIEWAAYFVHRAVTGLFCLLIAVCAAIFTAKVISFIFEKQGI